MKRTTRKPVAPVAPTATFADGTRIRTGDSVGAVVSTEFVADEYRDGSCYEMVTVRWDDAPAWASTVFHAQCLEPETLTDAEKAQREHDDARAFARIHD